MWDTRTVQITVQLPKDIAAQAEEVQRTDPDFLSRVVLYGLTRRSIYKHLREKETTETMVEAPPRPKSEGSPGRVPRRTIHLSRINRVPFFTNGENP